MQPANKKQIKMRTDDVIIYMQPMVSQIKTTVIICNQLIRKQRTDDVIVYKQPMGSQEERRISVDFLFLSFVKFSF